MLHWPSIPHIYGMLDPGGAAERLLFAVTYSFGNDFVQYILLLLGHFLESEGRKMPIFRFEDRCYLEIYRCPCGTDEQLVLIRVVHRAERPYEVGA